MTKAHLDLTTFGEMMLRLSVPAGDRLEMASHFRVDPAGAESNVMGALAQLQRQSAWTGGLPNSALGRLAANALRRCGVNLEGVIWNESGRIGTYFVELAAAPRSIEVIYDRANSCTAGLTPLQMDWDFLLNTRLLHLTGITPALSEGCRAITQMALARAHAANVPVSFDVNYRKKLWDGEQARFTLTQLIQNVELLFCSRLDAERVFGLTGSPKEMIEGLASLSNAKHVILTLGEAGMLAKTNGALVFQASLPTQILDRLGAGDALAAGVIHGWLMDDVARGLRYGAALAALALSQHGDLLVTTPSELETLLASSDGSVSR